MDLPHQHGCDLLARRGLVKKRPPRGTTPPGSCPRRTERPMTSGPRTSGHFRTRDGIYCYPLTVATSTARYLLGCHGLLSTKGQGVRPSSMRLFRGVRAARAHSHDNAYPLPPLASMACRNSTCGGSAGHSASADSAPPVPSKNGAHERMHRTLKARTARPRRRTLPPSNAPSTGFRVLYKRRAPHQISRGPDACLALPAVGPRTRGASLRSSTRAITFPSG